MRNLFDEMTRSERAHHYKAQRLERLATCHKVLAGDDGFTEPAVNMVIAGGGAGLSVLDAALQALQQGHGNMMSAAEFGAERSRESLHVMGATTRARKAGLFLADYSLTFDDHGTASHITYLLAFNLVKGWTVRGRADRLILDVARSAGLVHEATHCQHSYDCCGHWYQNPPRVDWLEPNLFAVRQSSYQNV